jgi:hypothetical protein
VTHIAGWLTGVGTDGRTDTAKWPIDKIIDAVADWLFVIMFMETTVACSEKRAQVTARYNKMFEPSATERVHATFTDRD